MSVVRILPENLANKIAAGEVVERPASVVKELAENSLDAGATRVFVDVLSGGVKRVAVSDDGCGMGQDDLLLALERHATSKISTDTDLSCIRTLGFRGEALPSIASVSRVRITTAPSNGLPGSLVVIEGGKVLQVRQVGAAKGTIVEVMDLFYNTPARLKFMKTRETEFGHIASVVEKMALANPGIHFRLTHDGRESLDCPGVGKLRERVAQVYGTDFVRGMLAVELEREGYAVRGYVSAPGVTYSDKARQETFVNGRPVKSPIVSRAIYDAYQSLIMKERHPACVIFLDVNPTLVDVNVHPAKREVRFADNAAVHRIILDATTSALKASDSADTEKDLPPSGIPWQNRVREAVDTYVSTAAEKKDFYFKRYPEPAMPRQEDLRLPRTPQRVEPEPLPHYHQPGVMQVADSYIVVPEGEGFMVIDQHAAHERVQYEKVKARHGKQGGGSQGLLVPEKLDLTAKEAALMEGILPELNALGLEVEHFGGGSFLVRSKPLFLEKVDVKELITGILADLDVSDVKGGVDALREKVFQLMACKSAVKAGQRLHPEAINRLIVQLFECEMPYTCAHGRPTVVRFGLDELEKLFKRK